MQKILPYLWFDGQAEQAARFYTSLFDDGEVLQVVPYPEAGPFPAGTVMNVVFRIAGMEYVALNGGPHYQFTPAVSFMVNCADQEETDRLWFALIADGGMEQPCGWLVDRFGLSWQIIPTRLMELMSDPDPEKAGRVAQCMLGQKRIVISELEAAHRG